MDTPRLFKYCEKHRDSTFPYIENKSCPICLRLNPVNGLEKKE